MFTKFSRNRTASLRLVAPKNKELFFHIVHHIKQQVESTPGRAQSSPSVEPDCCRMRWFSSSFSLLSRAFSVSSSCTRWRHTDTHSTGVKHTDHQAALKVNHHALSPAGDPVSLCCGHPPSSSSEATPPPASLSSCPAPPAATAADCLLPEEPGSAPAASATFPPLIPGWR